jgi:hypothetical protein
VLNYAASSIPQTGEIKSGMVLSFILVQNRQGKTRLAKWYAPYSDEEKVKLKGEVRGLPTTLLPEI